MIKKVYILTLIVSLILISLSANAAANNTNNSIKIKNLAKKYINLSMTNQNKEAGQLINEMALLGADKFSVIRYSPCPYRKQIKIAGKSVNATGKRCFVLKYSYNNKIEEVGECKEPN